MTGITIRGTGHYLPEKIVTNQDFTRIIDTSDEWIQSHTGIASRHYVQDEPVWYMGAAAAKQALDAAGMEPDDIDLIIGSTVTPDYSYPSMACLVQDAIGNKTAFCFDISAACAGLAYAYDMASRYLASGDVKNILIVCADALSQVTNFEDRGSCILFGDGAGANILSAGTGTFHSYLKSDGAGAKSIYAKHPRVQNPFADKEPGHSFDLFQPEIIGSTYMDGHEVYRFATKAMPEAVRGACEKAGIDPTDLDLILPHQANLRIIEKAAKNLRIPMEKFYVNIQTHGNTSSSSIAICIDEAMRTGRMKTGDRVCIVGFGAGLVYGACVFEC